MTGLALYDATAERAAAAVIAQYSTSFRLASSLLGPRVRRHVRNTYALVRVADEIVDGPARDAGLDATAERATLDALEAEMESALQSGFSANLVVHAFARSARACRITPEHTRPFFASMRTDVDVSAHSDLSHDAYVYGSAEVVGLMCLQAFWHADRPEAGPVPESVVTGARRLGAAFQDVNFLRDLDHDAQDLGRDYLGLQSGRTQRVEVLDRIDADLAAAAAVIPELPADCRRAVTASHDLFAELSARLRRAPADAGRVRVPGPQKALLYARARLGLPPRAPRTGARS